MISAEQNPVPLLNRPVLAGARRSPRKFLMNQLNPGNPQVLRNVNMHEEAAEVQRIVEVRKNSR